MLEVEEAYILFDPPFSVKPLNRAGEEFILKKHAVVSHKFGGDLRDDVEYVPLIIKKEYPFYAFFLYSTLDKDIADFINTNGGFLHSLSGNNCLFGVRENPKNWGPAWQEYWNNKLDSEYFEQVLSQWQQITPDERNACFEISERLHIDKKLLPCVAFVESLAERKELLVVPIISNKEYYEGLYGGMEEAYRRFFSDLFTAVDSAATAQKGRRIEKLRAEWRMNRIKWWLREKTIIIKEIKIWGSFVVDIADVANSVLNLFAPIALPRSQVEKPS